LVNRWRSFPFREDSFVDGTRGETRRILLTLLCSFPSHRSETDQAGSDGISLPGLLLVIKGSEERRVEREKTTTRMKRRRKRLSREPRS